MTKIQKVLGEFWDEYDKLKTVREQENIMFEMNELMRER